MRRAVAPERAGVDHARRRASDRPRAGRGSAAAAGDPHDAIDPAVGLADVRGIGDAVGPDRPIAVVHARSAADADVAAAALRRAVTVGEEPTSAPGHPVLRRIDAAE